MGIILKIWHAIETFFCFLIICMLGCTYPASHDSIGGLELNGFLAFLIWVALVLILIKVSAKLSVCVGMIFYIVVYIQKFDGDEQIAAIMWAFIAVCVGYWYLKHRMHVDSTVAKNSRKGIHTCPRCGSTLVHRESASNEFTNDYEYKYYDDWNAGWNRIVNHHKAHWVCDNCGKTWG